MDIMFYFRILGFPGSSAGKESTCHAGDPSLIPGSERAFLGFLCGSAGKESASNVGDLDSIPGLGRSPAEGRGYPLQYSGLENSMDYIVHGVAKSQTRLSLSFRMLPLCFFFLLLLLFIKQ